MSAFHYVYILVSEANPKRHYTGLTNNLGRRLAEHNRGQTSHTRKHRPWRVLTVIAFPTGAKAAAFERYLKSHSGRAFASKHF